MDGPSQATIPVVLQSTPVTGGDYEEEHGAEGFEAVLIYLVVGAILYLGIRAVGWATGSDDD